MTLAALTKILATTIWIVRVFPFQPEVTDIGWMTNEAYIAAYQIAKFDYYKRTGRDMNNWNPAFRKVIENTVRREVQKRMA